MDDGPDLTGDDLLPGGRTRGWRLRWSPAVRALFAVAVVLGLSATLFGLLAAHSRPSHRTLVVPAAPLLAATTTDAVGCPVDRRCAVVGSLDHTVLAAFARAYPAGQVLLGEQTVDSATGRVYRDSLTGRVGLFTSVVLVSQCIPGGVDIGSEDVRRSTEAHTDLNGDSVISASALTALVPGLPGCSVQLSLAHAGGADLDERPALTLARDPAVQLTQ